MTILARTAIYLLSPFAFHTHPLYRQLLSTTDFEVNTLNLTTIANLKQSQNKYIIFVDGQLSEQELFDLQTHPVCHQAYACVLFNAPQQANLLLLSQWKNLAGYFPSNANTFDMLRTLKDINQGENRLPRQLLINLFQYWQGINQHNNQHLMSAKLSLTRRELEILNHLQIGQSNLDIADSLFVSEHTIKSHLYRIFKKINVSNRRQAINWAQLYL
ncbi:helix-turn-helix transcriptional regulator [Vibrio sp. S11_S32]|uniref:LuxR C-terminal-related transcriptional regulator n=1 Tax=Vibrio sp. S11_S32 TaxID=2720225 RepID=UPI00168090C8|nr:LuxR C-terminal-related transcriptional regulator [Vibrio sp. S11_S32]MBD1577231.1 helix-turn-helix transcriptional regulator [Vibrio sp. S11_S32]